MAHEKRQRAARPAWREGLLGALLAVAAIGSAPLYGAHASGSAGQSARSALLAPAVRLADWQLRRLSASPARQAGGAPPRRAWEQAVFWGGLAALGVGGGPPRCRQASLQNRRPQ